LTLTEARARAPRLGTALAATAAALAAAALYNTLRTRRVEREHPPTGRFVEVDGVRLRAIAEFGGWDWRRRILGDG